VRTYVISGMPESSFPKIDHIHNWRTSLCASSNARAARSRTSCIAWLDFVLMDYKGTNDLFSSPETRRRRLNLCIPILLACEQASNPKISIVLNVNH